MKRAILLSLWSFLSILSFSQDARQILQQSFDKCQSVQNGHYVAVSYIKSMMSEDTISSMYDTHFKKIENDPNFSALFHTKGYHKGIYTGDVLYTGNEFVTTSVRDSIATVYSRTRWEEELTSRARTTDAFYTPVISKESHPLFDMSDSDNQSITFTLIGDETINGKDCYFIEAFEFPKNEPDEMLQVLKVKYGYWIGKVEMIPLQYTITMDLILGPDSLIQYEKRFLKSYELNNLDDESILTLDAIPSYYTIKDYVPYTEPDPLAINSSAPDWALPALNDERVHLSRLKGKVVLIDFFYKSCYPCLLALPGLQSLHEKYKDQGLFVVGINPVDGKESGIEEFMTKRGVTYPILLAGEDLADKYRVAGYPTMFLLDKAGKIIFIQSGYGPDMEKKLEKMIRKIL
ncbi:MAG TPA: redoxin domain-containing protein [Saprospiraceae bacterium]|nr:redoxin domain-containing protein [Saprospiraceae bacterium]